MKRRIVSGLSLSLLCGCVCTYQDVDSRQIQMAEVPEKVTRTFRASFPDAKIERVQQNVFRGKTVSYNFYFWDADGKVSTAGVFPSGEVVRYPGR